MISESFCASPRHDFLYPRADAMQELKRRADWMQPFRARSWIVASLAVSGLMLATPHCSNVAGPSGSAAAGACGANPSSDDDEAGSGAGPCAPSDSDGIVGGCSVFDVTVNDPGFSPFILKAENLGQVTLTLKNTGTKPHDFAVGCVPIALAGCPPLQCFPAAAGIAPLAPGDSATTSIQGQFVVQ
jgi:hypothetical protein